MLLANLTDGEKYAFLSLAVQAAKANDIVSSEEHKAIEGYCKEMGIAFFDLQNTPPLDEIYDVFSQSSNQSKKIVLMEIIGLMYADGVYDNKEQDFVLSVAKNLGLTDKDVFELNALVEKYILVTNDITDYIGS